VSAGSEGESNTGRYEGRVSIPASFRRVLGSRLIVAETVARPKLVIVYGAAAADYLECYTMQGDRRGSNDKIDALHVGSCSVNVQRSCSTVSPFPTSVDETGPFGAASQACATKLISQTKLLYSGRR